MAHRITISLPHKLTEEQVRLRLFNGIADARLKHPQIMSTLHESWSGNRMDFRFLLMGQSVSGDIQIDPHVVHVQIELPFLLALLADTIKPRLEAEGRKLLEAPEDTSPRT